jgi:hypothetical protein
MTILGPINLALVALTVPFVVSFLAAWAWSWRGIAIAVAGGIAIALLVDLAQIVMDARRVGFYFRPPTLSTALIIIVWLAMFIPGSIIGLAIRAIAERRLPASNKPPSRIKPNRRLGTN